MKASYPARHFTASNVTDAWGYVPGRTGDYVFGAAELFDRDDYGADYMRGTYPWPAMSPGQCNALFDRMGESLADVFTFAHRMGVKTCIGTETPLVIPEQVKSRLRAAGKNPADPAVVRGALRGDVPADRQDSSLGLLLALDARELDVGGGEAGADRRHDGRFSRRVGGGRRRSSRRSRWPLAAGCLARRKARRCSTSSCRRTCP